MRPSTRFQRVTECLTLLLTVAICLSIVALLAGLVIRTVLWLVQV